MLRPWIKTASLATVLIVFQWGCGANNNPYGPSGGGGGTVLLSETYESPPYTGGWVAPDPGAQLSYIYGGAYQGAYSVKFYSAASNATTSDHFRDTFSSVSTTVKMTTPLTTTFHFLANNLNPSGTDPFRIHMQIFNGSSDVVLWYLDILGNGSSYQFNGSPIAGCVYCPAAGSTTWHSITIKNTGTTTASVSFDGYTPESGITHTYGGGVTADVFGGPPYYDILHITTGNCISSTNYFTMDSLTISMP
jgi:hypothetical protein